MADDPKPTPDPDPEPSPDPDPTPDPKPDPDPAPDPEPVDPGDDWKAKARKHEDAAKSERKKREAAEAKVREFEDANKSESEKLTDRATTAEKAAEEANAELTRLRVAMKYDLSEEDLDFLGSGDEEQIEERAKRLAERLKPKSDPDPDPEPDPDPDPLKRRPTEKTKRTGATSRTEPDEMDPAKLADAIPTSGF